MGFHKRFEFYHQRMIVKGSEDAGGGSGIGQACCGSDLGCRTDVFKTSKWKVSQIALLGQDGIGSHIGCHPGSYKVHVLGERNARGVVW